MPCPDAYMNYLYLILSGAVIGLVVAAPIGPANLICIRRTLAYGSVNGFVSGLGAALGDGLFAIIAAFGLTAISQLIQGFAPILQLGGGAMLIVYGVSTLLSPAHVPANCEKRGEKSAAGLLSAMLSTFALTITNPVTMLGFAGLFAGLAGLAGGVASFAQASVVVGGVVAGSAAWWFVITTIVGLFHRSIDDRAMKLINRGFGIVVTLFGLGVLGRLALAQLG
jgi:threonine/homoserine/homoserine lactone efflux protein